MSLPSRRSPGSAASQAVRLPKSCRFDGDEVYVQKVGSAVVLLPVKGAWDTVVASFEQFTPDFMAERPQPPVQARDDLD